MGAITPSRGSTPEARFNGSGDSYMKRKYPSFWQIWQHRWRWSSRLWWQWILANAIGTAVGAVIGGVLGFTLGYPWGTLLVGTVLAFGLGVAQKKVLQGKIAHSQNWFTASTTVFIIAWILAFPNALEIPNVFAAVGIPINNSFVELGLIGASLGMAQGFVTGFAQWVVIMEEFSQSHWWIWSSTLGMTIAGCVAAELLYFCTQLPISFILVVAALGIGAIAGVIYGLVTGYVLVGLLRD